MAAVVHVFMSSASFVTGEENGKDSATFRAQRVAGRGGACLGWWKQNQSKEGDGAANLHTVEM